MVLDSSPQHLQQRLGNSIYESCRTGTLQLSGFPDYGPVIAALREQTPMASDVEYKVTAARGDKFVILQSLARRWLDSDSTKEGALSLIKEHNTQFNKGEVEEGYLEDDERTPVTNTSLCPPIFPASNSLGSLLNSLPGS